ncbi:hypothetical protein [Clostridium lundense]|uniref:hypothetical protein n=1 Tax=Clostridium lundense TaxID=319475 RepID=UPI000482D4BF|nr:hypothetical protein [Clostridium lundense]
MENKLKIKISETAYNKITELLDTHKEYDCVKFSYSPGCCKSPKVSILLDNMNESNIIDKIDDLNIIYDENLLNNISEIQLIYKNNGFAAKALPRDGSFPCNNTHRDNSSCGSGCSKCNNNCK